MELLKKSPYSADLKNVGLFLAQLHSQAKELKQLISPQLGNQVFFASQLLQAAPPLQPGNKDQIAALPWERAVKLDPYSGRISLMKTKPVSPNSPGRKCPSRSPSRAVSDAVCGIRGRGGRLQRGRGSESEKLKSAPKFANSFVAGTFDSYNFRLAFGNRGGSVPVGTAFHERTLALCES